MATLDERSDVQLAAPPIPVPRGPRYLTLDLWRGLACLMIVVVHATHNAGEAVGTAGLTGRGALAVLSRLSIGVPMFFVISGYCIAATSDSTRRKPSAPARFFRRRVRRIFPPYWAIAFGSVALTTALAAAGRGDLVAGDYGFIPHPSSLTWSQWLGNLTLTETWRHHLFGGPALKIVGPAWTLCYEEQFYAVCGVLLMLAPRQFFLGIAGVTFLTLIVAPIAIARPDLLPISGFFLDGRWLMFAEGVAVYYILNYAPTDPGHRPRRFVARRGRRPALWGISHRREPACQGAVLGTRRKYDLRARAAHPAPLGFMDGGLAAPEPVRRMRPDLLQPVPRPLAGHCRLDGCISPGGLPRHLADPADRRAHHHRRFDRRLGSVLPDRGATIP